MMQRGLDEEHETAPRLLLRDTRTFGMKVVDFFKDPFNSACLLLGFGMGIYLFSVIAEILLLSAVLSFIYAYTRKAKLPFRMPARSGALDYNDPLPGSTKPRKARGI